MEIEHKSWIVYFLRPRCLCSRAKLIFSLKIFRQHRTTCDAGGMVANATKPNRIYLLCYITFIFKIRNKISWDVFLVICRHVTRGPHCFLSLCMRIRIPTKRGVRALLFECTYPSFLCPPLFGNCTGYPERRPGRSPHPDRVGNMRRPWSASAGHGRFFVHMACA